MFDKDVQGLVRLLCTNLYVYGVRTYVRSTVMFTLTKINERNNLYLLVLMHKVSEK